MILSNIFEEEYEIIEAADGLQGLEQVRRHSGEIAAILLDVIMPVMSGFEMVERMRAENVGQEIPIFLITADASEKNMYEGFRLGAKDIIEKPFIPYFLKQRVKSVVDLFRTKEALQQTVVHQSEIIQAKVKEVKDLSDSIIETLALAIEFRSGETGQHVRHIHDLTSKLLTHLKGKNYPGCDLTDGQIEQIATASILHDIGKIAISDSILDKPGRLTAEEYEIMKTHTVKGAEMLKKMPDLMDNPIFSYAYDICLHHHERWDGSGYPDGLKGQENSIWAQAVALADVYDALMSKRCYKDAYPKDQAIRMIVHGECGAFNPVLLDAFLTLQAPL